MYYKYTYVCIYIYINIYTHICDMLPPGSSRAELLGSSPCLGKGHNNFIYVYMYICMYSIYTCICVYTHYIYIYIYKSP